MAKITANKNCTFNGNEAGVARCALQVRVGKGCEASKQVTRANVNVFSAPPQ